MTEKYIRKIGLIIVILIGLGVIIFCKLCVPCSKQKGVLTRHVSCGAHSVQFNQNGDQRLYLRIDMTGYVLRSPSPVDNTIVPVRVRTFP